MRYGLFGDKIHYEHILPPFVLVGVVSRFHNRYQSAADTFFGELSWKQMYFLNAITLFQEPPTIQDLADFLGCTHQNANKLYAKLLDSGYLCSQVDDQDRRKRRLFLTQRGKTFLAENKCGASQAVQDIFSVLTPQELETAMEILHKVTQHLDELYP